MIRPEFPDTSVCPLAFSIFPSTAANPTLAGTITTSSNKVGRAVNAGGVTTGSERVKESGECGADTLGSKVVVDEEADENDEPTNEKEELHRRTSRPIGSPSLCSSSSPSFSPSSSSSPSFSPSSSSSSARLICALPMSNSFVAPPPATTVLS
eukprot:CAMPEP_0173128950 /NCGR_PEP_ID=MMETSP1102-20130122/58864_1 /TAXON_ID=49646 /ORGANISM="Geminigera sp., Strain Caron Lab Isolate" /LENGTH=152 /DNA_ID=CAMNT_0014039201 /DNA_START=145 /DNA_END=604 /DNA_ORIENTATION=-